MQSLYTIRQTLLETLSRIEKNDGVMEEEDEVLLKIAEDKFELKLEEYRQLIVILEGDVATCKNEEARIKSVRQSKERMIERLKKEIVEAVNQFGDINKSGNRFVATPTCKFTIRNTQSVDYNDKQGKLFAENVMNYLIELQQNGVFEEDEVPDWEGILAAINAEASAKANCYGFDFEPYTIDDLLNLKFNTTFTCTIQDIFNKGKKFVDAVHSTPGVINVDSALTKTDIKEAIKNNAVFSFADMKTNQSITIK